MASKRRKQTNTPKTSYARTLNARKLSVSEARRLSGKNLGAKSESYQLPSGEVVSKRQLQQRAAAMTDKSFRTLEERARFREREGERNPQTVYWKFLRKYRDVKAPGMPLREFRHSQQFERMWESWQLVRHKGGIQAKQQRFDIILTLYRDRFVFDAEENEWRYV